MKKILGILSLLIVVCMATSLATDRFLTLGNIQNDVRRIGLFGIPSIGAAFVIVTGGIDLSIGSVICLTGCLLPWLLTLHAWPVPLAILAVLALAACIGVLHGLLVTRLRLQPFVVTLCGLLLYRGIARGITGDRTVGFGNDFMTLRDIGAGLIPVTDGFGLPTPWLFLVAIAVMSWIFFARTVRGRWLLALGRNEEAARLSGVPTERMIVSSYVVCALLAGLSGVLFVLDVGSAQASDFGNFYELYAIAGAVLGGCALSGGEVSVVGVLIGASVMQILRNAINLIDSIPNQIEFAVIGAVILGGAVVDAVVRRVAARAR